MGKIKKILETELVGGTQSTDVYPVTSTKAVYDTNNKVLDDYIQHLKKTSTFAGIATPTTNPGTPDGPVFYIAGEGTYANFSNIVIEAGQLGILKWNGTWSKEVLEIGAGGGSGGSGGGGGVVDTAAITKIVNDTIKNVSWWGQKINNNKVDGNIVITKGSHSFTIELDDNGNLKFNGNIYATGGITALGVGTTTGGGSGVSLGTLLAQLNNENPFPTDNGQVLTYNGSNFVWKIPTGGSGVTLSPVMNAINNQLGETTSNTPQLLYWDGSTYTWKNESEISGGSGSSSRIKKIKLFTNNSDHSFETIELGTADTIGFMAGNNVSLEAVVKEYTNVIKISATGGSGGSGGSTSTSVSWKDITNKPSTFTPSSHTHSTNDINNLSNYVQGVKVNNASAADRLANVVTLWGNNFSGNNSIGTASSHADLRYVKNIYAGSAFNIETGNNSLLKVDGTPTIYVGLGYMADNNARLLLFGNKTTIYTSSDNYRYDFNRNVFDVNSNQIHFGYETNGGKISWDAANNAFKIEGNVYATGGITALGVSNNATTSNNVDFTFKSVTINGTNQNKVQFTNEGLVFYNQDVINAYYKKDSIGLYDSANDACCKIFGFNDSKLVFDPDRYSVVIEFNKAIECSTDENSLIVGNNSINGYIVFLDGSTMTFNRNNKNYNFNVDKAIEQGILTI